MLTRDTFTGPWAGLPVAWAEDGTFDEATYRADVEGCCEAGVPGVYCGGTTGEFYAMEFDEFQTVARATVEQCHAHGTPAMVGCTSTYTLGAVRRARYAHEIEADAIQVALPYWMEIDDSRILPFLQQVTDAAPGIPLSIYDTGRAKKTLSVDQHRSVHQAVPHYVMTKATGPSVGATPEGCESLSEFVNVFVSEVSWATLGPKGAVGCCSAMVYWNPRLVLGLWSLLRLKQWGELAERLKPFAALHQFLFDTFAPKGFTDTAYDRLVGLCTGFLKTSLHNRCPYPAATQADVDMLRQWCREHFPELLER